MAQVFAIAPIAVIGGLIAVNAALITLRLLHKGDLANSISKAVAPYLSLLRFSGGSGNGHHRRA